MYPQIQYHIHILYIWIYELAGVYTCMPNTYTVYVNMNAKCM